MIDDNNLKYLSMRGQLRQSEVEALPQVCHPYYTSGSILFTSILDILIA